MSAVASARQAGPGTGFRHEALAYAGEGAFVGATAPFLEDALRAGDPTLVMVPEPKIEMLRAELGRDADRLHFADMAAVGRNPARIIPAWQDFVVREAGRQRPLRGVGEPVWPGRRPDELVECQRHERLLNLAFAGARGFWLVCPYDAEALDRTVLAEASSVHPEVRGRGIPRGGSPDGGPAGAGRGLLGETLPEPPPRHLERRFDVTVLPAVRALVARHAHALRCGRDRAEDFVLAVHEAVTNSVEHGGGEGRLRVWYDDAALVCEVEDAGRIDEPLVGRVRPAAGSDRGRGLWMANHLCDLVQIRSGARGTFVRMHLRRS